MVFFSGWLIGIPGRLNKLLGTTSADLEDREEAARPEFCPSADAGLAPTNPPVFPGRGSSKLVEP